MDAETLEKVLTHFGVRDCEKLLQLKRDKWDAAFNGNNAWQLKTQAAERDHVRGIVAEFLQYQKTVRSISGLARFNPSDDDEPAVLPRDCAMGGEEDSNWT